MRRISLEDFGTSQSLDKVNSTYITFLEHQLQAALMRNNTKSVVSTEGFFDFLTKKKQVIEEKKEEAEATVKAVDALIEHLKRATPAGDVVINTKSQQAQYLSTFENYQELSGFLKNYEAFTDVVLKQFKDFTVIIKKLLPAAEKACKGADRTEFESDLKKAFSSYRLSPIHGFSKVDGVDYSSRYRSNDARIMLETAIGKWDYAADWTHDRKYNLKLGIELYASAAFALKGGKSELRLTADEVKKTCTQVQNLLAKIYTVFDEYEDLNDAVEDLLYVFIKAGDSMDEEQKKQCNAIADYLANDMYGYMSNIHEDVESGALIFFNQLVRHICA